MDIKAELAHLHERLHREASDILQNNARKSEVDEAFAESNGKAEGLRMAALEIWKMAAGLPPDVVLVPEKATPSQIDAGIQALDRAGAPGHWRELRALFNSVYYAVTHDEKGNVIQIEERADGRE